MTFWLSWPGTFHREIKQEKITEKFQEVLTSFLEFVSGVCSCGWPVSLLLIQQQAQNHEVPWNVWAYRPMFVPSSGLMEITRTMPTQTTTGEQKPRSVASGDVAAPNTCCLFPGRGSCNSVARVHSACK